MSPVFPFLICLMVTSSRVSRVAAVHHPLWRACGRLFQRILGYHGCFRRWNSWASNFSEITYFLSQEEHIAVCLIPLVQSGSSYSSLQQAFYGISFFDNACGVSNLCKSAFLLAILQGCNPSKLSGVTILTELFAALVNRFATPTATVQPHFD